MPRPARAPGRRTAIPTPSTRLGLIKPSTSDVFSTADIAKNWQTVDDHPGYTVCTSTTRPGQAGGPPAWSASQAGMLIIETDTGLEWRWTGSAFVRQSGSGLLKCQDGTLAIKDTTATVSTSSTTVAAVVASVTNVVVPDGLRPLRVEVTIPQPNNASAGAFNGYLVRSATAYPTGTPLLRAGVLAGESTAAASPIYYASIGEDRTWAFIERNGLTAGTYSWSFQIMSASNLGSGTSQILATTTSPCTISVTEL